MDLEDFFERFPSNIPAMKAKNKQQQKKIKENIWLYTWLAWVVEFISVCKKKNNPLQKKKTGTTSRTEHSMKSPDNFTAV